MRTTVKTSELASGAGDHRLTLRAVIVANFTDLADAWRRFSAIVVAACCLNPVCARYCLGAVVIAAVLADAIRDTGFAEGHQPTIAGVRAGRRQANKKAKTTDPI